MTCAPRSIVEVIWPRQWDDVVDVLGIPCHRPGWCQISQWYPNEMVSTWWKTCPSICGYRRKFRSQTSDNMDRWKAEQGRGREKRKIRRKKSRERVRRKKMQMREKVGESRNTSFFQWFGAPEGRKVGSLKRRVRSQLARWEMKNCTPLSRSTFASQNVQNTWVSEHFWKCGAKHISKSKCTKHTRCGPLLAVEMSKKCTPLWREANFEVKMYKAHHSRTTFGNWNIEKVHVIVARSAFRSEHVQNTRGSDHFWRFRCRFAWQVQGIVHLFKSEQNVRVL